MAHFTQFPNTKSTLYSWVKPTQQRLDLTFFASVLLSILCFSSLVDITFLCFLLVSALGRLKECLKSALPQCHSAGLKHRQGRVGKQQMVQSAMGWGHWERCSGLAEKRRVSKIRREVGSRGLELPQVRGCVSIQLCCLASDQTSLKNVLTTFQVVIVFQ